MSELDLETQALVRQMADESAERAVKRTLTALGIDHNRPLEVQKDLAALRELRELVTDGEYQKDMVHLRTWRRTMDQVKSKGIMTAIGFFVIGFVAFVLNGFGIRF
jgi:hypothetical protein